MSRRTGTTGPKLLAGPILRRCSPAEINIWLAWSGSITPPRLTLTRASNGHRVPVRQTFLADAVAGGLNVGLVQATPAQGGGRFPTGDLLFYEFDSILSDLSDVLYPQMKKPSLILQEEGGRRLNVLYGSCRKYHGPGPDATRAADEYMSNTLASPADRINLLALTGDQIYADDVPDVVMHRLLEIAGEITGSPEPMPGPPGKPVIRDPSKIPIGERGKIASARGSGITSGKTANHLFRFGEFCAAYLMAWNQHVWPATIPDWADVHGADPAWTFPDPIRALLDRKRKKDFAADRIEVINYQRSVSELRRIMANAPTYMIFDDHEITDDWNQNRAWRKKLRKVRGKSPLLRRIVANGLAAYWLFQGFGNDPHAFKRTAIVGAIKDHLRSLKRTRDPNARPSRDFDEFFLAMRPWDFTTPTSPKLVFLDTRTRRGDSSSRARAHMRWERFRQEPPKVSPRAAPRLLNDPALRAAEARIRRAIGRDRRVVLVTPTPFYGLEAWESVQDLLAYALLSSTADYESFHADLNSYIDLLDMLLRSTADMVVILSGDVHFGNTVGAAIQDLNIRRRKLQIAQFTSSAAKNEKDGWERIALAALALELRSEDIAARLWWRDGYGKRVERTAPHMQKFSRSRRITHKTMPAWHLTRMRRETTAKTALVFAEALCFERASRASLIEDDNNFGVVEIDGMRVRNSLISWKGGVVESIKTDWTARRTWPVDVAF